MESGKEVKNLDELNIQTKEELMKLVERDEQKEEEQLEEIMEELDVSKLEADKIQRTIDAISKM